MLLPFLRLPPCLLRKLCVLNSGSAENRLSSPKHLRRCKVKPHGSLVPVAQRIAALTHPAYQRRRQHFLQETLSLRRTHLGASFVLDAFSTYLFRI